jgi:DNA-3-methyladenine glycosylase
MPAKLSEDFYLQKTEVIARKLLGKKLVRIYRGQRISGIITETEAYLGAEDRAAHSFGLRKTDRVQSMYLEGGHAYVYFIYGMHFCFNVVTRTSKHPEAVLIRALEPVEGIQWMERFRETKEHKNLTTGPAKLCKALKITRDQDGESLRGGEIFIEDAPAVARNQIVTTARIGVDYAEEAAAWPLRFYLGGSQYISRK